MSFPSDGSFNSYGQPAQPPKNRTGLIIGIIVGVVVLCVACGVVGVAFFLLFPTGTTTDLSLTPAVLGTPGPLTPESGWRENFSETFDNNNSQWSVGDRTENDANVTRAVADGVYTWNMNAVKDYSWWVWAVEDDQISDSLVTVSARRVSGPEDKILYGIVFRGNNDNLYLFQVGDDGYWHLAYLQNNDWETIVEDFNAPVQSGQFNRLTVIAKGSTISMYCNDQLLKTLDDTKLAKGSIAIAAEVGDNTVGTVEFDNLEIYTP